MHDELLKHKDFLDFLTRCLQYDDFRRPSLQQLLGHAFVHKAGSDRVEPSFVDPNLIRQSQANPFSEDRGFFSCPTLLDKKERLRSCLFQDALLTNAPSPVKQPIYLSLQHDSAARSMKKLPQKTSHQSRLQLSRYPAQGPDPLPQPPASGPDRQPSREDQQLLQSNRFNSLPLKMSDPLPAAMLKSDQLSHPEDSLASAKHWDPRGEAIGPAGELGPGRQMDGSAVLQNQHSQGTFRAPELKTHSLEASQLRKQQNFTFEAVGPRPQQDSDSQPICQSQFLPISEHLFDEQFSPNRKRASSGSSRQVLNLSLRQEQQLADGLRADSQFQHISIPLIGPNDAAEPDGPALRKLERGEQPYGLRKKPVRLGFLNSEQEPRPKNSNIEDSTPNDLLVKKRTFDFAGAAPHKPISSNNFLRVDHEQKASHATDLKVSFSRNTKVSQNPGLSKDMHSRLRLSGAKSASGAGPVRDAPHGSAGRDEDRRISQIFFSNKSPHILIAEEKGTAEADSPQKAAGFKSKRPRMALNLSMSRNQFSRKADTVKEPVDADFSFSFECQSQDQPPVASEASFDRSRASEPEV
jgi:hypothetical protein